MERTATARNSGERRVASRGWQKKSGQWPAKRAEASGDVRKAPNEANWNRPLFACAERVNVDVFGPVYAERTQFRWTEVVTLAGLPWRKPACRQSRPTPGSGGPD